MSSIWVISLFQAVLSRLNSVFTIGLSLLPVLPWEAPWLWSSRNIWSCAFLGNPAHQPGEFKLDAALAVASAYKQPVPGASTQLPHAQLGSSDTLTGSSP